MDSSPDPRLVRLQRALLVVALLALGAVAALAVVLLRETPRGIPFRPGPLPADIAARVAALPGLMDSHPDADVGRVLLPNLDGRLVMGLPLHSNAEGMRDAPLVVPKPRGTVRIALVGDSYVFGWGVAEDDRLGAVLQRELTARSDGRHAFDVRHIAVPSWNALNEIAYVRRRLSLLEADLVVLVLGDNDLDDGAGVRGFGELSTFDPALPRRADARLSQAHPASAFGSDRTGLLAAGLDDESRMRWSAIADALAGLERDVTATGARLRVVLQFGTRNVVARQAFSGLDARLFLWMPMLFSDDPANCVSPVDFHWSARAHGLVARMLYGVIRSQQVLPYEVDVGAWPESREALEALHRTGASEVELEVTAERLLGGLVLRSELLFDAPGIDLDAAAQVHGGIDGRGRLGPFAALVLRNPDARRFVLRISGLGRAELPSVGVRVELDELPVHAGTLGGDDHWQLDLPIPDVLRERAHLGVRIVADDWVAAPDNERHAISARLHEVALRP